MARPKHRVSLAIGPDDEDHSASPWPPPVGARLVIGWQTEDTMTEITADVVAVEEIPPPLSPYL